MKRELSPEARTARRDLALTFARGMLASGKVPPFKGADKLAPLNRVALAAYKLSDALVYWDEHSLEEQEPQLQEEATPAGW
jgi:hypothetical protein